jgi:hypothetical protein
MEPQHPVYTKFLSDIAPFLNMWPSAEVRYSVIRRRSQWFNFLTTITFEEEERAIDRHESLVELENFRTGSFRLSERDIPSFLAGLAEPTIQFGPLSVRLVSPDPRKGMTFEEDTLERYGWNTNYLSSDGSFVSSPSVATGIQGYILNGYGTNTIGQLARDGEWDAIQRGLQKVHYLDLPNFADEFLRHPFGVGWNSNPGVWVVAPFYVEITSVKEVEPEELQVLVEAPPRCTISDLRVTFILQAEEGGAKRGSVPLREVSEVEKSRSHQFVGELSIADTDGVALQLALREQVVRLARHFHWTKRSGNPLYRLFLGLDQAELRLSEALSGNDKRLGENNKLDVVVSWILHLCGFSPMLTDLGPMRTVLKGQEAPDLIAAYSPGRKVLIVETTTGPINENSKLSKLSKRVSSFRSLLPDHEVLGVITGVEGAPSREEILVAKDYRIAVIGLDDLRALLWHAKAAATPLENYEAIRKKIPT